MNRVNPILVVGDDPLIVDLLNQLLTLSGYFVIAASSENDLPTHPNFSLILMDLDPVTIGGAARLHRLRDMFPDGVPIIGFTADDTPHDLSREFEISIMFPKPFDINLLLQTVCYLLEK